MYPPSHSPFCLLSCEIFMSVFAYAALIRHRVGCCNAECDFVSRYMPRALATVLVVIDELDTLHVQVPTPSIIHERYSQSILTAINSHMQNTICSYFPF